MKPHRKIVLSRTVGAFVAAVVSCSAGIMALPAYAESTDTATPVQVATVADLNSAISGLTQAGTVQLTGDLTCVDDGTFCITVAKGKTVTIDLNGHSITKASATPTKPNGYVIDNGGALTITNSADAKSTISQENGRSSAIRNLGTLTLDSDNVTYASNDITIKNDENGEDKQIGTDGTEKGTLVVNGGTFTRVNEKGAAATQDIQNWSEATVNGGTFNNQLATWASDGNKVSKAGTLTVTNGTFKVVNFNCSGACTADESTPKATISGGTFQELTDSAANDQNAFSTVAGGKHADVSISDGTFAVAPNAAFIVSGKTYAKNDDGTYSVVADVAPEITTTALAAATVGASYTATLEATGTPAPTLSVAGLPAGLAFDNKTNTISGTPTTAGASTVTVTATNAAGTVSKDLTLTVNQAAAISTTALDSAVVGTEYTAQIAVTGAPAPTVTVAGLPDGLAYDAESGAITGTPKKSGVFDVTVKATNGFGEDATATLKLTVNEAPSVTVAKDATTLVNTKFSTPVTTTGFPAPTVTVAGLPDGLAYDAESGAITGTPTKSGVFDVTVKATNGIGDDATATLKLTVGDPATISTTGLADATVGTEYTATIETAGFPTPTVTVTGLPDGLAFDAAAGAISGTPKKSGVFDVTVKATNGFGEDATATLKLTVSGAPYVTTTALADATKGTEYTAQIAVMGAPAPTVAVYGLPAGIAYDAKTGAVSGTPLAVGTYNVVVLVSNQYGNATATLPLTVNGGTAPVIATDSLPDATSNVAYSAPIKVTGDPDATLAVYGLPAGLAYDAKTGAITGTTVADGTYDVVIVATNGVEPNAVRDLKLTVSVGTVSVYRVYNPNTSEHVYTTNAAEKDALVALGWADEGAVWNADTYSATAVYRVYNPNTGEHFYTEDSAEKDALVALGWNDEGVAWYASAEKTESPIYRVYNPNTGEHVFTADGNEKDSLVALGWNDEGIAFYGVDTTK
ncbi:MAG: putative Ig domain-containing protein [Pseudoscardovia radai]|nr:putative Ig domain-containing protein [Pseudoscardovia radai]